MPFVFYNVVLLNFHCITHVHIDTHVHIHISTIKFSADIPQCHLEKH